MENFTTLDRVKNKIFSLLFWMLVWISLSFIIDSDVLLPGPKKVLISLTDLIWTKNFWTSIFRSVINIGLGFLLGIIVGLLLAIVSYFIPSLRELIELPINIIQATPIASITIVLLIWIGSNRLSIFIVVFISLPNIYFSSLAGLEAVDRKLLEMACGFKARKYNIFKFLYWDRLKEFLLPNIIVTSGLAWKSGVSAEVLGLVSNSIGENIYYSKLYLNTRELFAWTFTIVVLSKLFQWLIKSLIKEVD